MSDKTEESVTIEEASSDLLIKKKNNSKEQEDSNSVELFLGSPYRCFSCFYLIVLIFQAAFLYQ